MCAEKFDGPLQPLFHLRSVFAECLHCVADKPDPPGHPEPGRLRHRRESCTACLLYFPGIPCHLYVAYLLLLKYVPLPHGSTCLI